MDKMYQIYLCEFDWYDDYEDEERHTYTVIMGDSFSDVIDAIEKRFPYANHITIHRRYDHRFFFLNKTLFDYLLDSEYDFEEYGEATMEADDAEFGEWPAEEDEDDVGATPESANDHYPSWSNHDEIPVTDEEDNCWDELGHALERCSYY